MEVSISSRGMPVTPRLDSVAREKISRLDRYLDGLERAVVHFSEERNPRITDRDVCEITLEGSGHHVRCKTAGRDPYTAVDKAIAKLERQLRARKTKLLDKYHGAETRTDKHAEANPVNIPDAEDIRFVREKQFVSTPMTAVEAVQEMELLRHDFFLFTSTETGRASVVYRRLEGDYGLLEQG